MSALARYFNKQGKQVYGYDKTPTKLTEQLIEEGISIHFDDDINKIPSPVDLVVYTPAIPSTLTLLAEIRKRNIPLKKRSEVLGLLTANHKTIAVAGTHGKTTVSTLIAHLFNNSKKGCNAFLGGIAKNYNSNLILSENSEYMVAEADEYDKSFLQLNPYYSIVTAMDADHLDIYGNFDQLSKTFQEFVSQTKQSGSVLLNKSLEKRIIVDKENISSYTYSLKDEHSDFYVRKLDLESGSYCFSIASPFGDITNLQLGMPGLVNVENAVAAVAISKIVGLDDEEIRKSLKTFSGIKRRFDYQINTDKLVYIDDYAHHPEEISRFIGSVRDLYPSKKILGIFQPHLYSRTRDFASSFAQSLNLLDNLILLPIYPARELPIPGVSSNLISQEMEHKKVINIDPSALLESIENIPFDVILTIGAGDIDKFVGPIKEHLLNYQTTTQ
ncbi:MAG: UDP-N-acetylmuramate--L-alanine ligase [Bacteroidales bacterium]|nr:UDP-N-acetylmuramate--L-alanine ligase [Bacteroidales bacterium]MCF8404453.1 UDP-N-acetylmuramate--L-alanine ligase [Bacteroidales bacterium]